MFEIKINPKNLPFDNKVQEMCKSCKRFGFKASCPPYVESVDYYKKLLPTYKNGIIYYQHFIVENKKEWEELGKTSSLEIHNHLLQVRDNLFEEGHYFAIIFGAGSCKMCEKCSFPCRQPQKSITPLEATGVDVVKLMKTYGVHIDFPVTNIIYRIGLVLYD